MTVLVVPHLLYTNKKSGKLTVESPLILYLTHKTSLSSITHNLKALQPMQLVSKIKNKYEAPVD
jgi:hypothetical protein